MTDIIEVTTKEQFRRVAELAKVIWTEHYTAIIGSEQVSYMLDKFQSAAAIEKQVKQNCQYYLLVNDEIDAGYFCHYPKGGNLFLSKLYVLKTLRGHGIGKIGLKAIEETAISKGYERIELTVNKYNTNSIKAYEKMGFRKVKDIVQDIGKGYVMDDYVMLKEIKHV